MKQTCCKEREYEVDRRLLGKSPGEVTFIASLINCLS